MQQRHNIKQPFVQWQQHRWSLGQMLESCHLHLHTKCPRHTTRQARDIAAQAKPDQHRQQPRQHHTSLEPVGKLEVQIGTQFQHHAIKPQKKASLGSPF
jgi:RecB family exonuclease